MSPKITEIQVQSLDANPKMVGVFRCGASLSKEPRAYISRSDAAALVSDERAEWRSGKKAVQLLQSEANCRHRDQSATMQPGVMERAAFGCSKDLQRVASWEPNSKGRSYSGQPNARKAA